MHGHLNVRFIIGVYLVLGGKVHLVILPLSLSLSLSPREVQHLAPSLIIYTPQLSNFVGHSPSWESNRYCTLAVKKFPKYNGTPSFIVAFTREKYSSAFRER